MNIHNYSKKIKQIKPAKLAYVAFLDILGFGNFILNNDHDEAVAKYQAIVRTSIDLSLTETAEQGKNDSEWIEAVNKSKDYFDLEPKLINVALSSPTMSDSLLLSTDDNTFKSFITLLATVRNLMAKLLYQGFPLRGAIAYGKITNDWKTEESNTNIIHHQLLGAPIVHASILEKRQNWSGCVMHSSVVKEIGGKLMRMTPNYLTIHEVPMKKYTPEGIQYFTELMPAVSWPFGISDDAKEIMNGDAIRKAFTQHEKTADKTVEEMIKNTIDYYNDACEHPSFEDLEKYYNEFCT